jgi:hypothetical protein
MVVIIQLHKEFRIWQEIVPWLTEHCGPVLNSKPIVYWRGKGWELSYERSNCWQVRIDDKQLLTVFLMRWA